MREAPVIVWFRNDLRLAANHALTAAVATGAPLVCCYILDDVSPGAWAMGGASRWWLDESLKAFARDIEARGGSLILRRGDTPRGVGETRGREQSGGRVFHARL